MLWAYCFPFRRSLSAGTASAASLAPLAAGSSARAVPAGVSRLHSKHHAHFINKHVVYAWRRSEVLPQVDWVGCKDTVFLQEFFKSLRIDTCSFETISGTWPSTFVKEQCAFLTIENRLGYVPIRLHSGSVDCDRKRRRTFSHTDIKSDDVFHTFPPRSFFIEVHHSALSIPLSYTRSRGPNILNWFW